MIMKKIGLLSDTHGYWDDRYVKYFEGCDEIWHAGDIGSIEIIDNLDKIAPIFAVYGNIDDSLTRASIPFCQLREIEGVRLLMTHIGGYPGKYAKGIKELIKKEKPNVFISGHSHILKVMYDKELNCLYINPGAAGIYGFHKKRTLIRFSINKGKVDDLEVIELN